MTQPPFAFPILFFSMMMLNAAHAHDQFQLIRNATLKIDYAGVTFLVDPLLAKKEAYAGLPGTHSDHLRNPRVELPISADQIVEGVDAVIVTHIHPDHWDQAAQIMLPKDVKLFVQNHADAQTLRSQQFENVEILNESAFFKDVTLIKTGGRHGPPNLLSLEGVAPILGEVMGVVLKAPARQTVYIAGDTVWCEEVEKALSRHQPDITVLNSGKAILKGLEDYPILMGKVDVKRVANAAPSTKIVAVHMDAINHCTLSRDQLRTFVKDEGLEERVLIPDDGEVISF